MIVGDTVRQSDLPYLQQTYRLVGYPTVVRVPRLQQGGGFGDQRSRPHAWAVFVQVDGLARRVTSARGHGREWNSLDRLERWLRSQGFRHWWVSNDLDPLGQPDD